MELPNNLLLYILLLLAVAAGYLLGRRERKPARSDEETVRDYYQGLNVLLQERSDLSVDRFVNSAEVSEQTLDVHLAMAAVVRRRGELDKGIAIHQNLLASPMLSAASKQLVELELARDYQSGGLLDRAETLLNKIIAEKSPQRPAAVALLIDLYEQERDWKNAIAASKYVSKPDHELRTRLAHFHFEIAQNLLDQGSNNEALQATRRGISLQPDQARGYWLRAHVEMQRKRYKACRRFLQKAYEHKGDIVAGFLPLYKEACDALEDDTGYENFLRQCLADQPNPGVLIALQHHLRSMGRSLPTSELLMHMRNEPQIGHVPILMELMSQSQHHRGNDMDDNETQVQIEQLTQQILKNLQDAAGFKCEACGFKSRKVTWHCPTCKAWGTFGLAA